MEKRNILRCDYDSKFHQVLRLPQKVTLRLHQILRLQRKVALELQEIQRLPLKTSRNFAPATKIDT